MTLQWYRGTRFKHFARNQTYWMASPDLVHPWALSAIHQREILAGRKKMGMLLMLSTETECNPGISTTTSRKPKCFSVLSTEFFTPPPCSLPPPILFFFLRGALYSSRKQLKKKKKVESFSMCLFKRKQKKKWKKKRRKKWRKKPNLHLPWKSERKETSLRLRWERVLNPNWATNSVTPFEYWFLSSLYKSYYIHLTRNINRNQYMPKLLFQCFQ